MNHKGRFTLSTSLRRCGGLPCCCEKHIFTVDCILPNLKAPTLPKLSRFSPPQEKSIKLQVGWNFHFHILAKPRMKKKKEKETSTSSIWLSRVCESKGIQILSPLLHNTQALFDEH